VADLRIDANHTECYLAHLPNYFMLSQYSSGKTASEYHTLSYQTKTCKQSPWILNGYTLTFASVPSTIGSARILYLSYSKRISTRKLPWRLVHSVKLCHALCSAPGLWSRCQAKKAPRNFQLLGLYLSPYTA